MSKNAHSIPTTAMLNAEAGEETETDTSAKILTFDPTAAKRLGKKILIGALVTASVYFAAKAVRAAGDEDEAETTED
ncbi:hypothetical protein SEA_BILO_29 [Streptomyces phage Bilo]|nr:hypothetical protein SEA_BILO_29 [Streptomyces phage Bilo]